MAEEIKTTMTVDQQQFMREMQKQVASIAKSSNAFLKLGQDAKKSADEANTGFRSFQNTILSVGKGMVGFGTISGGVIAGITAAVKLARAELEKMTARGEEALTATRTPANAFRSLFANAPPERREQLQQEVEQISKKTGAKFETVAPVLGGAYSSLANLDPKYAGEAAEIALRWFPDDPKQAEEIASRALGLMSSEKQQGRDVNPEKIIGSLFEMMQASMIRSAEQTFKSGMPGVAALAQSGMSVRKAEGFFAGMTNLNQDLTGERTKSTLQNLPSGMRTFSPETDQHRRERIRAEYLEALDVVDTKPKRREELVRKLDDQHITDPNQLAPVAAGMLREQAERYAPGTDKRRRLEEKTALVEKAGSHLRGRDPQGQDLDVPVAQFREFQKAGDIEEKLRVASKHRELGQSLLSHLSINATSEEALTRLIEGDKARWDVIDAADKKIHDADDRSAARMRSELSQLEGNSLVSMSGAQRRVEQSSQEIELKDVMSQRFGLAKNAVESMHKKLTTGPMHQWVDTQLMPIIQSEEAQRDPIGVALPKLKRVRDAADKELKTGRLVVPSFGSEEPAYREPLEGEQRTQKELQKSHVSTLIEILEQANAKPPKADKLRGRDGVDAEPSNEEELRGQQGGDMIGGPNVTVHGGDTKPVVIELQQTNELLRRLLAKESQPQSNGQPNARNRERTTTRPAAALAK